MLPASTSADLIAESGPRGLLAGIGPSAHQPLLSPTGRVSNSDPAGRPAEWGVTCVVAHLAIVNLAVRAVPLVPGALVPASGVGSSGSLNGCGYSLWTPFVQSG